MFFLRFPFPQQFITLGDQRSHLLATPMHFGVRHGHVS
jgi:hypothetical protein